MLVNCVAYENGEKVADLPLEDIRGYLKGPGSFVWVALKDPDERELHLVEEKFNLHELAVEDASHGHQRPKLEEYGSSLFVVLHVVERSGDELIQGEVSIFVGPGYIVSVRRHTGMGFADVRRRVNILPLGSAALAGTSLPIDREALAKSLGFDAVSRNSLDAVSDRDFCVEFLSACSLIMVHLSRLAEDIVLYATSEFGFLELGDAIATGSSLMPQKKNPDSMELVRGKAGRVFGDLLALLTTLKGLPLAYNKDMQEDKEAVFDAFDTVTSSLRVAATVLGNITVNKERAHAAASRGYMNATELADYLVRKGLPFREAHELVGRIVTRAIELGKELEEMSLDQLYLFSGLIKEDVYEALSIDRTLNSKVQIGGTAREAVNAALLAARKESHR